MKDSNGRKQECEQLEPRCIPPDYYNFSFYVSKERMITYWHQANEILAKHPDNILEVGIGNGIVTKLLESYGIKTTTVDINKSLRPDVVASVMELDNHLTEREFPFVLCARVLQHIPFSQFDRALSQLKYATERYLLLTLPVETLRFYIRLRITGRKPLTVSIPFPLFLKRLLQRLVFRGEGKSKTQNFWKINKNEEVSMANIRRCLEKHFNIEKAYQVPEDMSHAFFILRRKSDA